MEKMHFESIIHATPETVWDTLVDQNKFRNWSSVFHEGSYFEGGWEKGDSIRFLTLNDKGEKEGMISQVMESKKYSFISIKHLGIITRGIEDKTSDTVKQWAPAYENYTLTSTNGFTKLEVDVDVDKNLIDMFGKLWPKALSKLKEIAEK